MIHYARSTIILYTNKPTYRQKPIPGDAVSMFGQNFNSDYWARKTCIKKRKFLSKPTKDV